MKAGLFVEHFQMSPPGSGINGCVLVISFVFNASWNIFDVNLNQLARLSLSSNVFVFDSPHSVLSHQPFLF